MHVRKRKRSLFSALHQSEKSSLHLDVTEAPPSETESPFLYCSNILPCGFKAGKWNQLLKTVRKRIWRKPRPLVVILKITPQSYLTSVQFSGSVVSNSLRPHGEQQARLTCPTPAPGACSKPYPLSRWCHPTISSYVIPFSSCLQSFPASESFPMSRLFASGVQSIGASTSASVLPVNIQNWFLLGLTDLISLHSKGPSRAKGLSFEHHNSKASILQRSAFFLVQVSHSYMTTGKP